MRKWEPKLTAVRRCLWIHNLYSGWLPNQYPERHIMKTVDLATLTWNITQPKVRLGSDFERAYSYWTAICLLYIWSLFILKN